VAGTGPDARAGFRPHDRQADGRRRQEGVLEIPPRRLLAGSAYKVVSVAFDRSVRVRVCKETRGDGALRTSRVLSPRPQDGRRAFCQQRLAGRMPGPNDQDSWDKPSWSGRRLGNELGITPGAACCRSHQGGGGVRAGQGRTPYRRSDMSTGSRCAADAIQPGLRITRSSPVGYGRKVSATSAPARASAPNAVRSSDRWVSPRGKAGAPTDA